MLYAIGLGALALHAAWISWPVLTTDLQRGLSGHRLASYDWVGKVPIKAIELPLLPSLLVQSAMIALALLVAHWCWRLVEEPLRQWSRRRAASL